MNVTYNERTRQIYETLARISREIAVREEKEKHEKRKNTKQASHVA